MKKKDVKSFAKLVVYAEERAKRSVLRKDPQAWAYWEKTRRHAVAILPLEVADWSFRDQWPFYVASLMFCISESGDPQLQADYYSHAKWFRIMALNQGKRDVKPLSLSWLKELYKEKK